MTVVLSGLGVKIRIVFSLFILTAFQTFGQTTWYSYQTGAWNNPDVWTTDAGGSTLVNPGSLIPGTGDVVVILPSRVVTLRSGNVATTGLDITIQSAGVLDDSIYNFTSGLSALRGQGKLRLKSINFPSAPVNTLIQAGGGTIEYYNTADFTIPSLATYNNLIVNCAGFTATQLSNFTIFGDLKVQSGTYMINDASANRLSLIINGSVNVSTGASLTVGTGNTTGGTTDPVEVGNGGTAPFLDYYVNYSHRIEIYGDFINNGTVKFTNQAFPVFNAFPTNGMASVFFRGTGDKTLTCNGNTDFYNLIIDKGTDRTYILNVNSAAYDKFRIFGANNAAEFSSGDVDNPNIRKALWIRTGTLKLNGYVIIPSLVEGSAGSGDFMIPGNGGMVLGGPDIVVMGTIDDYRAVNAAYNVNGGTGTANGVSTEPSVFPSGFSLCGKLQIEDGYFYLGEIGRITYCGTSTAEFLMNGGKLDSKQFQSVTGGGKISYHQTGGDMILRGRFKRNLDYTTLATMIASIGNLAGLNTVRSTVGTDQTVGTFNIDQDANIFQMEGGAIKIYDASGATLPSRALEINSDPVNVNITGGNIEIYLTTGSAAIDSSYGIATKVPLYNLTITRNSGNQTARLLSIPAKAGVTSVTKPPLIILNNLTLTEPVASASEVLKASGLDVETGGNFNIQVNAEYNPGGNHTILNGAGAQTFTNSGTITAGLYKFIIDKNSGTATLGSNIAVRDSLIILGGTLNDGGYTLSAAGNILNKGTHSGNGKIVLNGTGIQTISANSSAAFGNIDLQNSTNPAGAQLASDVSVQSLVLTANTGGRSVTDIGIYNLNIANGIVTSSGTLGFGASKMLTTSGHSSDKGLTQKISLTGSYTNQLIATYPLGVGGVYFPAEIYCNGNPGTTSGTFTVTPVNSMHPATDPNHPDDALPFFWRTKSTGFSGLNAATINQSYYHTLVSPPLNKAFYLSAGTWAEGSGAIGGIATFNGLGFLVGDYTAGKLSPFGNPVTYYSRQSGAFNVRATWSTDPVLQHRGAAATSDPKSYDMIVIGGQTGVLTAPRTVANDSVWLPAGTYSVASITINGSYTGNERRPVLNLQGNGGSLSVEIIQGAGKLASSGATLYSGSCDMGLLLTNASALVQFYGAMTDLPASITTYPNLLITGSNTKILPAADVVISQNLMIADMVSSNNALQLNGTAGNLTVNGKIQFLNGSKLIVPISAVSRSINVYGDIDFKYLNTNNINAIQATSGAGTTHNLNFYGRNIISGSSNLTFNPALANKIDLYFKGPGPAIISEGSGTFGLNRLFIQKDVLTDSVYFKNNFILNETNNNTVNKSLNPGTGTLILSDQANGSASTINLNLSSGGPNYFTLNSNSAIILRNGAKINITGNTAGSGIRLDGMLQAEGASQINLANGAANTGYIEYTGSGNASLNLFGASVLNVDQVRRPVSSGSGTLRYNQAGTSTAVIYGQNANNTRAKFDVAGSGSIFKMSGTSSLSILKGGGTTFGDLYLQPASTMVTGGDIIFGTGTNSQAFSMDANISLNNITLNTSGSANSLTMMVSPLVLNGNLLLNNANSIFNTNNVNVTIKGNLINNGTYNAGTSNTSFSGIIQTLGGSSLTSFYDLTVSPVTSLTLSGDVTVNNNLTVSSGILACTANNIELKGDVINNATITNDAAPAINRLYLHGAVTQNISGTGCFGRIELNNALGARVSNNLTLTEDLTLTLGILNINQHLLTLGVNSKIVGAGFGINKKIMPDGVFSNIGIKKYFNAGYTGSFTFPISTAGKYTPAVLQVSAISAGFVRVNTINERHTATLDPFNVLNYFWEIESGLSAFQGTILLNYSPSDVTGTESNFVAARLIVPPGTGWSKASTGPTTDNVNEASHVITFDFPSGTDDLGGHYTAGDDACIPNIIPVYTSNVISGNWDDPASWTPVAPAGGPNGFSVIILPGHTIFTNGNRRFSYSTEINGTLEAGTSYGHNLGTVTGTGKLKLSGPNIPAGRFDDFLACSGGSLEFSGNSDYTIVADRFDAVRNLYFTGTGTRILPDKDLIICNQLQINGPTVDNSVNNRKLSIGGTFDLTSGSFLSGSGDNATVVFNGSSAQTIAGFNTSSGSPLNNLQINNSNGLTLNSVIEMNGNLLLTNGLIITSAANMLKMINPSGSGVIPAGGSAASYVSGPMSKSLFSGNNFIFPTGKGRHGKLQLLNVQNGVWQAEYFDSKYSNTSITSPLTQVSATEYWKIVSPVNGTTATVQLRWDTQSDISPLTTVNGLSDIKVAEFSGASWTEKTSDASVGDDNNGTVQTSGNISINNNTDPQYYTLGSVTTVKPAIFLGPYPRVCRGSTSANLTYTATSGSPDQYKIIYDAAALAQGFVSISSWTALPASPVVLTVPGGAAAGTYNATIQVRASGVPGNLSVPAPFTVVLTPLPAAAGIITGSSTVCQGQAGVVYTVPAIAEAEGYTWTLPAGASIISGANTNSITVSYSAIASSGNITVTGTNVCGNGTISANYGVIVNPSPVATFNYPGTPYCRNAANPSPAFTGGGVAGTFSSTGGLVFVDASTGQINIAASLPGTYTVTNRIDAAGGCNIVFASGQIVITNDIVWTGTVNTNWNLAGNWSCGYIPDLTNNVLIPNVPNKPVLNAGLTGYVNNLTIDIGASLTISGNTLQIAGSITNNGTFTSTSGSIQFNGSVAQTLGTNIFAGNEIRDLTVNNPAGVTLQGLLNVTGIVKAQSGNLASGGNLTLISTAAGTALINGAGGGQVLGNVTMQRYLPGGYGYKYFSSPFQAATVSEFGDDIDLTSSAVSIYKYDENRYFNTTPLHPWVTYKTPGTNPLLPMAGYSVNFGPLPAGAVTVDLSGVVNNGPKSLNLFNNNHPRSLGFNAVGNPYPSPVDWDLIVANNLNINVDNAVYYCKTSDTDQWGWEYTAYINGVSTDGLATNIIPSMQGFLVHVTNGTFPVSGSLIMNNSIRITDQTHAFVKSASKGSSVPLLRLSAGFSGDAASDPVVIYFHEKATTYFDNNSDALKLLNTDINIPSLYAVSSDGLNLSINALPSDIQTSFSVPLGLTTSKSGEVVFKIATLSLDFPDMRIYFKDNSAGAEMEILQGKEYKISLPSGEHKNRFFINFSKLTTSVPENNNGSEDDINIYCADGILKAEINRLEGKEGLLIISNFSGQTMFTDKIYDKGLYEYNPSIKDGLYIVSYITGKTRIFKKIIFLNK